MHNNAAVIDAVSMVNWHADDADRRQVTAGFKDFGECVLGVVEQDILHEQVIDGVSRDAELRENGD